MFWESVWGILGALISVPLTVAITTYLQTMDHPMPRFLGELFYRRTITIFYVNDAFHSIAGMLMGDFSFLESSMVRLLYSILISTAHSTNLHNDFQEEEKEKELATHHTEAVVEVRH